MHNYYLKECKCDVVHKPLIIDLLNEISKGGSGVWQRIESDDSYFILNLFLLNTIFFQNLGSFPVKILELKIIFCFITHWMYYLFALHNVRGGGGRGVSPNVLQNDF